MSGEWYESGYGQSQSYHGNVNRYPTPSAKSNGGDYDEYYSSGSAPQATRGTRPYVQRGGRGQFGNEGNQRGGRGNMRGRGSVSRGRGNFGGNRYPGSRGGSAGRPFTPRGRGNGFSMPSDNGHAGPQRGRGGNRGSSQQYGMKRETGGFNQQYAGNQSGQLWNNGQQPAQQAKKRQREISPSRWTTNYDKPLPQQLLNECTPTKCGVCEVEFNGPAISKSHYDGKSHDKKVKMRLEELIPDKEQVPRKKMKNDSAHGGIDNEAADKREMMCELCNITCGSSSCYETHLNGKSHRAKVLLTQTPPDARRARCDLCGIEVSDMKIMESHVNGKSHQKKLKKKEVPSSSLFCELCNVSCSDLSGYNMHLKGKRHTDKAAGGQGKGRDDSFKCEPCQMEFQNKDSLILHNVGDGHKLIVAKLADASAVGAKVIDYEQLGGVSAN